MALALEITFGICSLLGIGHAYAGRVRLGVALMFGWWVYFGVSLFLAIATLGLTIWLCLPIWVIVPVVSGVRARRYALASGTEGSWASVKQMVGSGRIGLMLLAIALLVIGGIVAAISQTNAP